MKFFKLIAIIGILALALWAPAAQATLFMDITDYRVTNQLTTTGVFSYVAGDKFDKGFKIAWHITEDTAGAPIHYVYTISAADGTGLGKTLSHWILEVSAGAARSDFSNFNGIQVPYVGQYVPATWTSQNGSPGQPGDIYGIRFNSDTDYVKAGTQIYTFSFDTLRMPTWGDFFAKDGGGSPNYAYNTGFGTDPDLFATDFNPWILVPDTKTAVPLPGSVLLLGTGLVGLGLVRFRLRQKKA